MIIITRTHTAFTFRVTTPCIFHGNLPSVKPITSQSTATTSYFINLISPLMSKCYLLYRLNNLYPSGSSETNCSFLLFRLYFNHQRHRPRPKARAAKGVAYFFPKLTSYGKAGAGVGSDSCPVDKCLVVCVVGAQTSSHTMI